MRMDAMTQMQQVLDVQSAALLAGDAKAMRDTVALPYRRVTSDLDLIIETEADAARGVTAFTASLQGLGVNHFIRLVTDAEYLNDHYLEGHYVTHALRNATAMVPSYDNRMVLRLMDGQWRMVELVSNLSTARHWPVDMLRVAEAGAVDTGTHAQDARRNAAEPLALYQTFLDRLTDATLSKDFDAYIALCGLPYTSHIDAEDTLLRTPEDVRPFFDMTVDMITSGKADDFQRRASQAEFLGSDLICGYHTSHFIKDGTAALAPIKSRMILKRRGVTWALKSVTNALSNAAYPYRAPEPSEALPTHREILERTKSWPTLH